MHNCFEAKPRRTRKMALMKNNIRQLTRMSAALVLTLFLPMLTLTPAISAGGGDLMKEVRKVVSICSTLSLKVKAFPDLAYGKDQAQKIDVYAPPGAKSAPIIFMVHGGAWLIGDKSGVGVVQNKIEHSLYQKDTFSFR